MHIYNITDEKHKHTLVSNVVLINLDFISSIRVWL